MPSVHRHLPIRTVGNQDADFAPREGFGSVPQDAQSGRRCEISHGLLRGRGEIDFFAQSQTFGHSIGELRIDVRKMRDQPHADRGSLNLAELKDEGIGDVARLPFCLAEVELTSLAVVVGEGCRAFPHLATVLVGGEGSKSSFWRFPRPAVGGAPGVGFIVDAPLGVTIVMWPSC